MRMGLPDLPEGPVTLLFTDIEGSTALRTTLGDADADELFREHDELIRQQVEENKGQDQKAALGDGFLAVFVSTRRALACAIGIQRELDSFNLRVSRALRVRIGLNTGEVASQDGQLSGEAVHAAARVCAEASGGQILVSDVTRQLAGTVADVTFHDTGEHHLKGLPEPWRLWEVVEVRETTQVPEPRRRLSYDSDPRGLTPERQRRYFFNAVGSFVARAAKRFPLMLVMDYVHWADEPTLLLIEHMAAVMPELRVFGVGTYRDVELDVARPLAATLERLVRARIADRLPVKRFDRGGVAAMLG